MSAESVRAVEERGPATRSSWLRVGVAVGTVVAAWALRKALTPLWGPSGLPFIFFYPALVFSAWYGRLLPGLLSLALGAGLADWSFIDPIHHWSILGPSDLVAIAVFIGSGGSLIFAIEAMHRANDRARKEIEERKRSEAALLASQQSLTTMYRSLPVGITLARLSDGRYVDVND